MEWLAPLAQTWFARALVTSPVLYPLVSAAHIMAIGLLFGGIIALDMRMLGLGSAVPLPAAARYLSRIAGIGLLLAVLTGFCLFCVRPLEYAGNPAFLAKLALVALGLLNILAVHLSAGWRQLLAGGTPQAATRIGATISILIWTGAIIAGRWIGFL
ncbi:hypothetical protein REJC140_02625 [Pseudorhizobium endolithicum]|uniref:DUF2214 domain-containing protein n=1 Tax=Pseudorhizobium endolithicum TaxID=1191678 RepID=A0ABN7JJN2_9HYPH|nr:DUF2214 domain-containing protein [Pseudorhizobium endolithicum]CAD7028428.1 hypothetical protein REJC140_02625 [Pseudorhizobium endolithicum]